MQRPGHAPLIAWSFMVAGLGKLVGLPLFVWALRDEAAPLFSDPEAPPLSPGWLARAAGFVVGHLHFFVAFWMLLGLFMIAAAAGFLRGKPWARVGLVLVCWFGIFEASLVAVFIYSVRHALQSLRMSAGDALASSLLSRFWVSLAWLGLYAILLILLRGSNQGDRTHAQDEGQSQGL